jgi:hypothetical protein
MRTSPAGLLAAAVLAVGGTGLLVGCSTTTAGQPAAPTPTAPTSASTGPIEGPITPPSSADRAPLGFEIRYVDSDGGFATVAPENFPR